MLAAVGLISASAFVIGDVEATEVIVGNAESVLWGDQAVSIARTDTTGGVAGSFLTVRGFDGIVFKTFGDANFGTGDEQMRITPSGVVNLSIASGSSLIYGDNAVSVSRTNTSGDGAGPFLNLRGFSGIVFRIAGDANFGTGLDVLRIDNSGNVGIGTSTPLQKLDVNGSIRLTGSIVSPNAINIIPGSGQDVCIGVCP